MFPPAFGEADQDGNSGGSGGDELSNRRAMEADLAKKYKGYHVMAQIAGLSLLSIERVTELQAWQVFTFICYKKDHDAVIAK